MRFIVIILNLALLATPIALWFYTDFGLMTLLFLGAITIATPLFSIAFLFRATNRAGARALLRNFLMGANIIYLLIILINWMHAVSQKKLVTTDMPAATMIAIGSFTLIVLILNVVSAVILTDREH